MTIKELRALLDKASSLLGEDAEVGVCGSESLGYMQEGIVYPVQGWGITTDWFYLK